MKKADKAIPSLAPSNSPRAGTRMSEPPIPAEADNMNDRAANTKASAMIVEEIMSPPHACYS